MSELTDDGNDISLSIPFDCVSDPSGPGEGGTSSPRVHSWFVGQVGMFWSGPDHPPFQADWEDDEEDDADEDQLLAPHHAGEIVGNL